MRGRREREREGQEAGQHFQPKKTLKLQHQRSIHSQQQSSIFAFSTRTVEIIIFLELRSPAVVFLHLHLVYHLLLLLRNHQVEALLHFPLELLEVPLLLSRH